MENMLGKLLEGRYLIEELIGVGGMANVYKGFDTVEQRTVAVKMLRDEYAENEDFVRRFRNESKAISSLDHACIVKIYDVLLTAKNPAIVMEFVEGITLKEYIDRRGKVDYRVATALIAQLLAALQHAHDNGIVHRDVKPQNIIVSRDGNIKVMDFGIARFAMSQSRTLTDRAIGSVHYISPEQARGDGVVDQRTDIYSAGVILFEMLTGSLPFEADSPVSVAIKQIEDRPLFPREINPEIPRGLEDITVKAMAKNPARRYQSAGEMLDDLGRFVDNPAIVFGYTQAESTARKKTRPAAGKDAGGAKKSGRFAFLPGRGTPGQKASALSVLFGVTCAFVVGTIVFVIIMLAINRPFAKVPEVDMPNLIGQSYDSVRNDRAYSQFSFEVVSQEFNTHYEKGVIFEQDPTSGKRVKEGITIKVKVSTGAQTVILPDFTDEEATLTYAKLTELGLLYTYQEEFSNTAAEGHVIRTDPGKNETVAAGSTVTVYVSKGSGKPKVVVPDLVGQDISYAKDLAAARDLVLSIKYEASIMDPGTVLSQAPGYPAQVDSGSTVYVTVASDETIETSSTSIYVWMPQSIDEDMVLTVELDGDEVYRQTVVPADQRVIKVPLTGEGISMANSYLNGRLLQVNEVNFDDGTSPRIEDHSADFE